VQREDDASLVRGSGGQVANDDKRDVDDYGVATRRIGPAAIVGTLLLVAALLLGGFAVLRVREVTTLRAEVADLRDSVGTLEQRNRTLASRVGETEKGLAEKRAGIAPLAKRVLRSVFTVSTAGGLGSGFAAWREDGATFLVTADHVIVDADGPNVRVSRKGGSWMGEVVGRDRKHDLAVVRISGRPAGAEPLWQDGAAARVRVGDELLLLGSPYGLEGTVTTGVVSRVTRKEIQTDAAANPGNSGGPAIDEHGNVVGVLVAGGGQNINFAVPIQMACRELRSCG
jgi:S1-C subfamily serine protease